MSAAESLHESSSLPIHVAPLDLLSRAANYVRSSWVKSSLPYRPALIVEGDRGEPHVWRCDAKQYWTEMSEWIDAMLERPTTTTLVARANNGDGLVLGWACWSRSDALKTRVHYVYTCNTFRRMGVASRLLAELPTDLPIEVTARTPMLRHLRSLSAAEWVPTAIWRM